MLCVHMRKTKQKMASEHTTRAGGEKIVVEIKERVKCVDLYFTFRKLLHCITCGCKASSSSSSTPSLHSFSHSSLKAKQFRDGAKRFVLNEDKYENIDFGQGLDDVDCIMSYGKDLLFSHIWKPYRFYVRHYGAC